jgi:cellobiose-specific phosphotransferase system component IIC
LEGLEKEDISALYEHLVYIFYGLLVNFSAIMVIWYIFRLLWPFGIFFRVVSKKSGNPVENTRGRD